jgi:excisionase family DNA binding protein
MSPIPEPDGNQPLPPKRSPAREAPEPLIDSDEAAALIGIHPKTLQRYARQKIIVGARVGRLWRFRASIIDEWISRKLAS